MSQLWFYQNTITIKYDTFYICAVVLYGQNSHAACKNLTLLIYWQFFIQFNYYKMILIMFLKPKKEEALGQ